MLLEEFAQVLPQGAARPRADPPDGTHVFLIEELGGRDAYELAHGMNVVANDRATIPSGYTQTNLQLYLEYIGSGTPGTETIPPVITLNEPAGATPIP